MPWAPSLEEKKAGVYASHASTWAQIAYNSLFEVFQIQAKNIEQGSPASTTIFKFRSLSLKKEEEKNREKNREQLAQPLDYLSGWDDVSRVCGSRGMLGTIAVT